MINEFSRAAIILGEDTLDMLSKKRVAVFGVGGVGGFVCEALARCGIGHIALIDNDTVSLTNINRQIIALHSTIGMYKTQVMKTRIRDINPACTVEAYTCFYTADNADTFDFTQYDYIVDAIDTVSSKLIMIERANLAHTPIISSMGCGNKLDPTRFEITDIYKTSVCPLARVMRRELKLRGIKKLKVLYSTEQPVAARGKAEEQPGEGRRSVPGSISFVPSAAGLIIAAEVIQDLTGIRAAKN
ncbi:MAG: tRNA threonylcarbamoyladenosine dehydratase [Oscillospiraceae bacterium]|nr:tRNA threonylcarbamoyladenosine dehydratase [Oscillospiraceae bacterium]